MLKIKDKIDLKELEKYGLEYENDPDMSKCYILEDNFGCLYIMEEDRKINLQIDFAEEIHLDTLYDLINDGLVEKVSDEE